MDNSPNTAVIVGDHGGAVLKAVSVTLQKAGFEVINASNGRAALELCSYQECPVDLAVIDTGTTGIRLVEVAELLHQMPPKVRMLFLSDQNAENLREWDAFGHVRRFLSKPFRRSRFLGRVLEMMDQPAAFVE